MNILKLLDEYAEKTGIIIGVCDVLPIDVCEKDVPFMKYTCEERKFPALLLESAKSIIVIGVGYNLKMNFDFDGLQRGLFSVGAVGLDYHIRLRNVLEGLKAFLTEKGLDFKSFISVDTGPLSEKTLAVKSGLGWFGKNGLVISKKFGSFFNVGYMVTTIEVEAYAGFIKPHCGKCSICIDNCPGKALSLNGFDYQKCVSYLTQKRGELMEHERKAMGIYLYGCDACQKCCPHNFGKYSGEIDSIDSVMPLLDTLINITQADFKKRFQYSALYWRGRKILKRNAMIVKENLMDMNKFPF